MMFMRLLFTLIFLFSFLFPLFAQNWETVRTLGGIGNESLDALEVMEDGNIIIAGSFEQSLEVGGEMLTSAGEEDVYCSIYNATGNHVQSFQIGGSFEEELVAVTSSGNLITLFGSYNLQANFDSIELETSLGTKGLFLTQYNTEGEVQWAHSIEGNILSISGDMASGENGTLYITGYFYDTLIVQQDTLIANSTEGDLFVAKFTNDGILEWISQAGNDGIMRSTSIAIDSNEDIIISGKFKGEASFSGETIQTNTADHDIFVAKLNNTGDFLWAKKIGGVFEEEFVSIAVDENRNIYMTGYFLGVMSSEEGWEIQTTGINLNAYLIQLNPNGLVNWGFSIGGTNDDYGIDISVADDRIVVTGYFQNETNWGNGDLVAEGGIDALVATYNLDGDLIGMIPVSGEDFEIGSQVKFLPSNQILVGGSFNGTCIFDEDIYDSNGAYDVYWAIENISVSINEVKEEIPISFFPNPSSQYIYWDNKENRNVYLFDVVGRKILSSNTGVMDVRHLIPGMYFLETEGIARTDKIIIRHQ